MHEIGFNVLLGLIGVHVLAVLFYQFVKKDRLIEPMVTGNKAVEGAEAPRLASLWLALVVGVLAVAFVWWISVGAPLVG
jgi:hypothetical protein